MFIVCKAIFTCVVSLTVDCKDCLTTETYTDINGCSLSARQGLPNTGETLLKYLMFDVYYLQGKDYLT